MRCVRVWSFASLCACRAVRATQRVIFPRSCISWAMLFSSNVIRTMGGMAGMPNNTTHMPHGTQTLRFYREPPHTHNHKNNTIRDGWRKTVRKSEETTTMSSSCDMQRVGDTHVPTHCPQIQCWCVPAEVGFAHFFLFAWPPFARALSSATLNLWGKGFGCVSMGVLYALVCFLRTLFRQQSCR